MGEDNKKVGRNDPCPCGSGKKYKKCCLGKDTMAKKPAVPKEILAHFQKFKKEEIEREKLYGKVRPIIHQDFQGHKLVAVGNRLHWAKQEKWKTFPDFLMEHIKSVLGSEWGNSEIKKPFAERNQILQWYHETCLFQQSQTIGKDGIYDAAPNGAFAAYLSLAYDLYVLRHHRAFHDDIVRRLKIRDQFQGVRYELFAAATCIRAGFDIAYEDETDRLRKHPEFIATHRETGQRIAVEAKSKHREGVLGRPGQRKSDDEVKIRVGGLINNAIQKETPHPLVIFVDVNLPPTVAKQMEIKPPSPLSRVLDQIKKNEDGKDKFNLIIFTNHPHHYGHENEPDPKKHVISVFSQIPMLPTEHPSALLSLNQAALQYGNIPNEFPDN